jgi:DNA repair protein RadA/Sms
MKQGYVEPCPIQNFEHEKFSFIPSNTRELDRVLGGGFVAGGLYALNGPPGAGKSTLALQAANDLSIAKVDGKHEPVLYISAEEDTGAVVARSLRLSSKTKALIYRQADVVRASEWILKHEPLAVVWDSIQRLTHPDIEARAGSMQQVMECAQTIESISKEIGCISVIVCHVIKDGSMAGPKMFEHLVDCVLSFEHENEGTGLRILRASKNRFGSSEEVGIFRMTVEGLQSVENPIALLDSDAWSSGNVRALLVEGSRPLLNEVQALCTSSKRDRPQRNVTGLDRGRVEMIAAVLTKRCGIFVEDLWMNAAGGFDVKDTGADLAIALSILSSYEDEMIEPDIAVFGEIGLTGELRAPKNMELRLNHARAMGCKEVIGPPGIERDDYVPLANLDEVCDYLGLGVEVKKPKKRRKK